MIDEAIAEIKRRSAIRPTIGIVLGSGLSELADEVPGADIIPTGEIPHWPGSTVHGHKGRLVLGRLENRDVLLLQGRSHYYEGFNMQQITFPVRVMHRLGIGTYVVTNAAGGLNPDFAVGDLMVIKDHINMPGLAGENPLRGPNDDAVGPRFPDMTHAYDPALRRLAQRVAAEAGFSLREGIYCFVGGPSYETPAELRLLKVAGGDAVGMSTVPEVIVACHSGMRVLGISSITNQAHLEPDEHAVVSHEEVLEAGKLIIPRLKALIHGVLSAMDS